MEVELISVIRLHPIYFSLHKEMMNHFDYRHSALDVWFVTERKAMLEHFKCTALRLCFPWPTSTVSVLLMSVLLFQNDLSMALKSKPGPDCLCCMALGLIRSRGRSWGWRPTQAQLTAAAGLLDWGREPQVCVEEQFAVWDPEMNMHGWPLEQNAT